MAGEWRDSTIGELCDAGFADLQTGPFGTQLHAHDYVEDGVPVVPTEALRNRQIAPPGETYNEAGVGLPFYQGCADFGFRFPTRRIYCTAPTRLGKAGDTLVSVRAPVGDINMATENCAIGRGVAAVRHKTGSRSYSYQFMQSIEEVFARFEAEGTVFGSIGKKDFHAIACVNPPRELVLAYEARVSPVDDRVEVDERESRTVTALRDTLLPKLISGELRVRQNPTFDGASGDRV